MLSYLPCLGFCKSYPVWCLRRVRAIRQKATVAFVMFRVVSNFMADFAFLGFPAWRPAISKICCLRYSEAKRDELRYCPHSSSPFWAGQIILLSSLKEPMRGNPIPAVHRGQTRMGVSVGTQKPCRSCLSELVLPLSIGRL